MFNPNENSNVTLNKVIINGFEVGKVSDTDAQKLYDIVRAMMSNTSCDSATSVAAKTRTVDAPKPKKKDDKFPAIEDSKKYSIGDFITVYPSKTAVRHWNEELFTPKKVKYAISKSLTDAGAKWNKEISAYQFSSKTELNKWVKAQKERA